MPTGVQDKERSVITIREFVVKLIFIWRIKIRLRVVLKERPGSIQIWTAVTGRTGVVVDELVVIVCEEYR